MPASPRRTSAPLSPRRTALSNSSSLAHSPARPRSIGPQTPGTPTSAAPPGLPVRCASRAPLAFPALALSVPVSLRIWTLLTAGSNKPPPRQLKPLVGESRPPPDRRPVVQQRLTALQERDLVIAAEGG